MDIQMPEMDGIEAFTVIQGINESIPVIALTANVMMEDVQKYNALGFVGHIGKPIDLVRFYEVLEDTWMWQNVYALYLNKQMTHLLLLAEYWVAHNSRLSLNNR